jgi:hypothetical protein
MEKLTFEQIIEKLKTIFDKVDDFAYEEIPISKSFSKKALEAENKRDEYVKLHRKDGWYQSPEYIEYSKMPSKYDISQEEYLKENNIPVWEEVEQYGGEGQGDTWYSVKYFPDHDVYIRVDGFYSSYNGTDFNGWSDCTEVRPQEKTITVYQTVK